MDTGALHCCSRQLQEQVRDSILDFDSTLSRGEKLSEHRKKTLQKKREKQVNKNKSLNWAADSTLHREDVKVNEGL